MEESLHRVGAERFSTPREIIRDFITVLNLIQQNPGLKFDEVVHGGDFKPSEPPAEPDESEVPEPVETTAASAPPATADQQFKEFKL